MLQEVIRSNRLSIIFRLILGAVIITAAIPKLIDIDRNSVYLIYSYNIFPVYPVNVARFLGLVVPYLELLIGSALILGFLTRLSAAGWGIMSLVYFLVKLDIIFIQKRIMPCGCFGGIFPDLLVTQSIWIDVATMLLCTQIVLAYDDGRNFVSLRSKVPERWRRGRFRHIW